MSRAPAAHQRAPARATRAHPRAYPHARAPIRAPRRRSARAVCPRGPWPLARGPCLAAHASP
eukprot:scaffold105418_cov42-Phaeocystis_antarctica.AAC.1